MNTKGKVLMGIGALLLIALYIFPIWSIELNAPQYPEGLGMNISINNVEGKEPNHLQNINGLNHYIGMKHISPESIPELKIMPPLFAFMIVFGLGVAAFGNRKWVAIWIGLMVVIALAGLVDFYLWEYNYGHDLNPNAPIKVPGMSYQPPLLGSKQLLNIKAVSMPHIGFYFALLSMALGGLAFWKGKEEDEPKKKKVRKAAA